MNSGQRLPITMLRLDPRVALLFVERMRLDADDVAADGDGRDAARARPGFDGGDELPPGAAPAMRGVDDEAEDLAVTAGLEQLVIGAVDPAGDVTVDDGDEHGVAAGCGKTLETRRQRVNGDGIAQHGAQLREARRVVDRGAANHANFTHTFLTCV